MHKQGGQCRQYKPKLFRYKSTGQLQVKEVWKPSRGQTQTTLTRQKASWKHSIWWTIWTAASSFQIAVGKCSWQMYMYVAWLYICNQESCKYAVNAQHNLCIMIKLPPSPCLSQYRLASKSHYYTTDVNTQGQQTSHNPSHTHIWCNQRNTESKSKATLSCSCIA